ncbi:MAG: hypothetical protein ACI9GY_000752, partial [Brevundimonas sp.]
NNCLIQGLSQASPLINVCKIYLQGTHLFLSLPADLSNKKYRVLNVMCQGTKICPSLKNMINIIKKMTFSIKK